MLKKYTKFIYILLMLITTNVQSNAMNNIYQYSFKDIDGNKLNLKGQGSQRQDGKRGALFLEVKIKPHPSFERQDLDLVTQVSVPIPTIVLGGKVRIPTLSQDEVNSVELTIPPGTQPGNQLRVRGQGVVDRTGRCGDLRIKIQVEIPKKLTQKERKLYEKLGQLL